MWFVRFVVAFVLVVAGTLSGAAAAGAVGDAGRCACSGDGRFPEAGNPLDGYGLGWLPAGGGPIVTDVAYEWDDISFTSRVWESGPSDDGAYRVDLQVTVLRGSRLGDAASMRAFLAEYHEQNPDDWARDLIQHRDGPGYQTDSAIFWLAEPGVAIWVQLDQERFTYHDLVRVACGVHARPIPDAS